MTTAKLKRVVSTFMQCLSCKDCVFVNTCIILEQTTSHSLCYHLQNNDDIETGE